jgi:NAD(P)-dependent dehydrogenase (short-subunit alcohol dehydrogenase family)
MDRRLLDGRVAVITGAGGGIGRAQALLFALHGAAVVVNDAGVTVDGSGAETKVADAVVKEIEAAGGRAVASHDSVTDADGAERIIGRGLEAFGQVDVLVNNAGILRDKSFAKMDMAMWNAVIDVHLTGTFRVSQAFVRHAFARGGGGRIVNTTSVSGMLGNFGQANYAAAKAGIYGLTRTMSIELQKHKIYVNAIAPIAKTRMTEALPMFEGVSTMTPEHVAPAALFFASDLSKEKTGHVLAVAGARMYAFKVVETAGRFKEGSDTIWTADEIAENWGSIVKA